MAISSHESERRQSAAFVRQIEMRRQHCGIVSLWDGAFGGLKTTFACCQPKADISSENGNGAKGQEIISREVRNAHNLPDVSTALIMLCFEITISLTSWGVLTEP